MCSAVKAPRTAAMFSKCVHSSKAIDINISEQLHVFDDGDVDVLLGQLHMFDDGEVDIHLWPKHTRKPTTRAEAEPQNMCKNTHKCRACMNKEAHKHCTSHIHITYAQHICISKMQIPCTPSEHNICEYTYVKTSAKGAAITHRQCIQQIHSKPTVKQQVYISYTASMCSAVKAPRTAAVFSKYVQNSKAIDINIIHMHIKYAYQKCRFNVHQVSTTYVNIYKPKYVKKKEQQHNKVVHAIDTQHSNSKTASVYSTNNKCVLSRKNTFLSSSIQQVCAAEVQSNWCSASAANVQRLV
jgi:hypothetical protein